MKALQFYCDYGFYLFIRILFLIILLFLDNLVDRLNIIGQKMNIFKENFGLLTFFTIKLWFFCGKQFIDVLRMKFLFLQNLVIVYELFDSDKITANDDYIATKRLPLVWSLIEDL